MLLLIVFALELRNRVLVMLLMMTVAMQIGVAEIISVLAHYNKYGYEK